MDRLEGALTWREWGIEHWNDALFHYFFSADRDDSPVACLVVTAQELRRAVSDDIVSSDDVLIAFRNAVRVALASSGRSLCEDGIHRYWMSSGHGSRTPPRFFAHLVVTCLAAAGTADSGQEGEFRRRLNDFLGRSADNPNYNLAKLPLLWESLASWLERAIEGGRSFRRLVLDREPHLKIIGYSVHLAFPNHKDRSELINLASVLRLSSPPPVRAVLRSVENELHRFSDRFLREFTAFKTAFFANSSGLESFPFWSAVRDAVRENRVAGPTTQSGSERMRCRIRLDRDFDDRLVLSVLLSQPPTGTLPTGVKLQPCEEFGGPEFSWLLGGELDGAPVDSVLLSDGAQKALAEFIPDSVTRAIREGVLLFEESEDGIRGLVPARPMAGDIWALVRGDLASALRDCLSVTGLVIRPSRYTGWSELAGFQASDLPPSWRLPPKLANILVLQEVIETPRILLRGGVQVGFGLLGRRECLPLVGITAQRGEVTIRRLGTKEEPVSLLRDSDGSKGDSGGFRFPAEPSLPRDIEGGFLLSLIADGKTVATRAVDFVLNVLSTEYKTPIRPQQWLSEGIRSDVAPLGPDGKSPAEVTRKITSEATRIERTPWTSSFDEPLGQVVSLIESLAAVFNNRRGLGEGEICDWFCRMLAIDPSECWPLLRSWVESGVLDCLFTRSWRGRHYFPRRPHLIVHRDSSGLFRACVAGLVPTSLVRDITLGAGKYGISLSWGRRVSPHSPALMTLAAPDLAALRRIAETTGLPEPLGLVPLDGCVADVEQIAGTFSPLPANHVLVGRWDWDRGRFSGVPPKDDLALEWYRREDAPDSFVVRRSGEAVYHSLSRQWALLVGHHLRGASPFAAGPEECKLEVTAPGVHLPVGLARWAAAASGSSPGPSPDGSREPFYQYPWPSRLAAEVALARLGFGPDPSITRLRNDWILALLQASLRPNERLVPLPSDVAEQLRDHLGQAACPRRLVPDTAVPRLRAAIRSVTRLKSQTT